MRYGSVCSGIEAATVAWHGLGWEAAWYSEIEPFPCAVLAHHYPDVPNHGDMTLLPERILAGEVEAPDLLCGGTPCQAFSVAGQRRSLDDARGNLSLTFCEVADAIDTVRLARGDDPAIIIWENVPGVLNTKDNAFGCFLAQLAGEDEALVVEKWPRAGVVDGRRRRVAWAVLDAQYFGLAQRRRRVFVLAVAQETVRHAGNRADPAEILSIGSCLRRDTPSRSEPRQGAAGGAGQCFAGGRESDIAATYDSRQPHNPQPSSTAQLTTQNCAFVRGDSPLVAQVAPAMAVAFHENQRAEVTLNDTAGSLKTQGGKPGQGYPAVMQSMQVRRLTPRECERLQGVPDDYTQIPLRGKPSDQCPDGPRYKAIGNSWAVPVVRWIGERIADAVPKTDPPCGGVGGTMRDKWETLHHSTEAGTDDWRTPREFFEKLHAEFGFVVDAAASPQNAMLPDYWTVTDNALAQDWTAVCREKGGAIWCNPPYGRNIGAWVTKAWIESTRGATVVLLTFARTDTVWWHSWAAKASEIRFVKGRLRFEKPDGTRGNPAPVPSVVLVFKPAGENG